MNKKELIKQLRQDMEGCRSCNLHEARNKIVHGRGCLIGRPAPIMLIGQAPGGEEDDVGVPFIGPAGELLMEALLNLFPHDPRFQELMPRKAGDRIDFTTLRKMLEEIFWFSNMVLCWPPEDRQPATAETNICRERLMREIYIVDPVLIITLGRIAHNRLTKQNIAITDARGKLYEIEVPGQTQPVRYNVYATYHPSYIGRMQDYEDEKGKAREWFGDLTEAMQIVDQLNKLTFGDDLPDREEDVEDAGA